jgi:hypothetical protein
MRRTRESANRPGARPGITKAIVTFHPLIVGWMLQQEMSGAE